MARTVSRPRPGARVCSSEKYNRVVEREAAFWAKVGRGDEGDCWLWVGAHKKRREDYGMFHVEPGVMIMAHRASYMLAHGPITSQQVVCHRCDTPRCVNPHHLWLGTHADNNKDRARKGRSGRADRAAMVVNYARGERHAQARITAAVAAQILADPRGCIKAARAFGVGKTTVLEIRRGQRWAAEIAALGRAVGNRDS